MMTTRPEQVMLARDRCRRRWVIRIGLSVLVTVIILTGIALLMLSPSGLAPEEAETVLKEQLTYKTTRVEVERLLGKAHGESIQNGSTMLVWRFTKQTLNHVDEFEYKTFCNDNGTIYNSSGMRGQLDGWSAWWYRWYLLKWKMGFR